MQKTTFFNFVHQEVQCGAMQFGVHALMPFSMYYAIFVLTDVVTLRACHWSVGRSGYLTVNNEPQQPTVLQVDTMVGSYRGSFQGQNDRFVFLTDLTEYSRSLAQKQGQDGLGGGKGESHTLLIGHFALFGDES